MFGMRLASGGARETYDLGEAPAAVGLTSGLVAGTRVATEDGWQNVQDVQRGDLLLTFDDGLLPVRDVRVQENASCAEGCPDYAWPLRIPEGVIGNREALSVLPHQPVMMESDVAEDALGDPFVVIPAKALLVDPRVERVRPAAPLDIVQILFDTEQVVFAAGGLVLCPPQTDLLGSAQSSSYQILSQDRAEALVALGSAPTLRAGVA